MIKDLQAFSHLMVSVATLVTAIGNAIALYIHGRRIKKLKGDESDRQNPKP
jgi:hypothetical protein